MRCPISSIPKMHQQIPAIVGSAAAPSRSTSTSGSVPRNKVSARDVCREYMKGTGVRRMSSQPPMQLTSSPTRCSAASSTLAACTSELPSR